MNIIQLPSGVQKVVFTPDDIKALLLTAAQTQLGLATRPGSKPTCRSPLRCQPSLGL